MKNNKHVESFGQFNENLNISDVMGKMLKELSNFCDDFKDKWGKELHYL